MLYGTRRPFYAGAENIGAWYTVFDTISLAAVVTNCAMIAFTSRVLIDVFDMSDFNRLLVVVVIEHLMLLTKLLATRCIPATPAWLLKIQEERRHLLEQSEKAHWQRWGAPRPWPVQEEGD